MHILFITCLFMTAELYAIIKLSHGKDSIKHPLWASFCPVVYIMVTYIRRRGNNNDSATEQLRAVLKSADEKMRQSDGYGIMESVIRTGSVSRREHDILIDSLTKCYNDFFARLPEDLTDNEKAVCVLHHWGVKPQIIGDVLFISYATVRTYKGRLKLKLSAQVYDLFFISVHRADVTTCNDNQNETVY